MPSKPKPVGVCKHCFGKVGWFYGELIHTRNLKVYCNGVRGSKAEVRMKIS